MTSNANLGAERPPQSSSAAPRQGVNATSESETGERAFHNPRAEELLHRYLSEIHGYRQLGNAALSELEKRLAALSELDDLSQAKKSAQASAKSQLTQSSLRETAAPKAAGTSLNDRLKELSAYLHADLAKHQETGEPEIRAPRLNQQHEVAAPNKPIAGRKDYSPHRDQRPEHRSAAPKLTPNAPILDRAWFEERFATMRSSIDQLAEQIPTKRLDTLESQFQQLMERLEARETGRSEAAV